MSRTGKLIYSGDRTLKDSKSKVKSRDQKMVRKISSSHETLQPGQSKAAQYLAKIHGPPTEFSPIEVKIVDGQFESNFKKFKLLFQREKVIGRLKEIQHYEKPSEKKRRKRRESLERRLLTESRERMMASGEWDKRQKRKAKKRQNRLEQKIRTQESSENLEDYGTTT